MPTRRKIHRIGITTRSEIQNPKVLENIIHCLQASKKEIFLSQKARKHLSNLGSDLKNISDIPREEYLDLLIVFGGDGTILSSVRNLSNLQTYVFGINAGNLGFLSEVPPDNLENTCLTIWDANYTLDERMLLNITIEKKNGEKITHRALNEVVISQAAVAKLVSLPTAVDGQELATFRADGLIIATPTGSTAYNLSAGGPIVHPRVEAMILTPIAPFSFTQKPLVIPSEKTVSLTISDHNADDIVLTIDGQVNEPLSHGDNIFISRHHQTAKFLRLPEETYFRTIRGKLKWGEGL